MRSGWSMCLARGLGDDDADVDVNDIPEILATARSSAETRKTRTTGLRIQIEYSSCVGIWGNESSGLGADAQTETCSDDGAWC